ncbi:MAG: MFS transporter [Acidobacteriota bacterium]|nr:MFS transporter [Acidobacteriota bacterium]
MPLAFLQHMRELTKPQRRAFTACFLGWSLDSFDFFILTFCLDDVATQFQISRTTVTESIFATLAMRPVGALLFGWLAERFGRRPVLMANIVCFSVFELASAFAPSWHIFLFSRALFGIAMGGEWGVGAALALESLPVKGRGFFSGLLQEGYVAGNFLAAAVYGLFGLAIAHFHLHGFLASWRVLFVVGSFPALLVFYVNAHVEESPAWKSSARGQRSTVKRWTFLREFLRHIPKLLFLTLMMFAFMSFSHGTQDLYPRFLKHDHLFSAPRVSLIAIVGNIGAFAGGVFCGSVSERFGRKRTIVAAALLAILVVPLWAWSHTVVALALGGFLMQFMVQGAWGVVPAHLNELSPGPLRSVLPGLAYQLGALLSSWNIVLQSTVADRFFGGRLAPVIAGTVLVVGVSVATITAFGAEAKGADLSRS